MGVDECGDEILVEMELMSTESFSERNRKYRKEVR